ncbi:E3 ubiquitin-protein ligase RMA1H1 [Striga asiatica]|uniref:E3 ubiquitin-protein ligase RMA n=1 Tax=Striga asiatica TaxID=4170 RepID=A0A5A7QCU9_STRAF|nr:E3 ubiquitin-protein ligase RMA1H1 [Striga asiatica]
MIGVLLWDDLEMHLGLRACASQIYSSSKEAPDGSIQLSAKSNLKWVVHIDVNTRDYEIWGDIIPEGRELGHRNWIGDLGHGNGEYGDDDIHFFYIMAFQQNFSGTTTSFGSKRDFSRKQTQNSSIKPEENPNGCFDCNICLDSSHEPVITLCGHLYCWPCIYKWLRVQNSSLESKNELPKCPVCKSHISTSTLVPLYGPETKKKPIKLDLTVPHRPPPGLRASQNYQNPFQPNSRAYQQSPYLAHSFAGPSSSASFNSPTMNMVGELVFARMFRSQDTNPFSYPYYSNYNKSLNHVSIFLFCFIIFCLILF